MRARARLGWSAHLLPPALLALLFALVYKGDMEPVPPPQSVAAPPPAVPATQVNPWRRAALRVEEDRGGPVGRAANVHIPPELRHYADRRRFLAVQVAAWKEQDDPIPHDDAALASMILAGELVEVPALGDDYILYGVGANATGEPFTHYEGPGAEIPLFAGYDWFEDAAAKWSAEAEEKKAAAAAAAAQAAKLRTAAQARRRRALLAQARQAGKEAAELSARRTRVVDWYDDQDRRRELVSEWRALDDLARRLRKRPYDLDDAGDRRALRGVMLGYLRAPARDMVLELAAAYRQRFSRPLPITSLVRTEAYQRQLGETNPNATRIGLPPHATGLAFDVYDHYMTGPEQDALMDLVAARERAGRVEALRENRDHIHVFAFADGRRPPERLVAEALGLVRPVVARAARASGSSLRASASRPRGQVGARRAASSRKAAGVRRTGSRTRRH